MGKIDWDDRAFKKLVDAETVRVLTRIGIRGEALAKQGITGRPDPELKAVDTGRLRASITHEIHPDKLLVRVGTNVQYAIFVFLGTVKMTARPVLRQMLMMIRAEMKGK